LTTYPFEFKYKRSCTDSIKI